MKTIKAFIARHLFAAELAKLEQTANALLEKATVAILDPAGALAHTAYQQALTDVKTEAAKLKAIF